MLIKSKIPEPIKKSIAVFDVGKTNKKLLIYDYKLELIESVYQSFEEYDMDGIKVEPMEEISEWLIASLTSMADKHDIGVISATSHGSAFTCIDSEGKLSMPVLSYSNDPGPEFHSRFSDEIGDPETFQRDLKTPDLPGLGCFAKWLYFTRERFPDQLNKTTSILPLVQYFGFLLTGNIAVDFTSIGAHTALWNFETNSWSSIPGKLGIKDLLPASLSSPWDVLGTIRPDIAQKTGIKEDTLISVGIHDSNSSLLPHLIKHQGPFVVHSTGTAPNTMHPTDTVDLLPQDIGKVVFFTLSAFMTPIKTTMFLGGMEFDFYRSIISPTPDSAPHYPLDQNLLEEILVERQLFILPSFIPFGMFPDSAPRIIEGDRIIPLDALFGGDHPAFFSDYPRAYHVLVLLVVMQAEAAIRAAGLVDGMSLFIEGGFSRNDIYTNLLASLFPNVTTYSTNLVEATAFGSALVGKAALTGKNPHDFSSLFEIERKKIIPQTINGLNEYRAKFLSLIQSSQAD